MTECGNGPCFACEALAEIRICSDVSRKHFDSDSTIEPRVARLVDLAHSARTERRHNFVRPETPTVNRFIGSDHWSN